MLRSRAGRYVNQRNRWPGSGSRVPFKGMAASIAWKSQGASPVAEIALSAPPQMPPFLAPRMASELIPGKRMATKSRPFGDLGAAIPILSYAASAELVKWINVYRQPAAWAEAQPNQRVLYQIEMLRLVRLAPTVI
jgi:hypothetical protein